MKKNKFQKMFNEGEDYSVESDPSRNIRPSIINPDFKQYSINKKNELLNQGKDAIHYNDIVNGLSAAKDWTNNNIISKLPEGTGNVAKYAGIGVAGLTSLYVLSKLLKHTMNSHKMYSDACDTLAGHRNINCKIKVIDMTIRKLKSNINMCKQMGDSKTCVDTINRKIEDLIMLKQDLLVPNSIKSNMNNFDETLT